MSKPQRQLKKKIVIYCEGDTEYNYFDAIRKMPNVEISIQAINMHGGGYRNFLTEIRKSGNYGKIATFIIIDGDRAEQVPQEKERLKELMDYCKMQNEKKSYPSYFLVVNNPDFEYVACLHDEHYKGGNIEQHITKNFGFKDIEKFKENEKIYDFLHKDSRHHKIMLEKIKRQKKLIENEYEKKSVIITVTETKIDWDLIGQKSTNINEIFEILEV